jgi:8-oxo-dGTP diphosphatase
MRAAKRFGIRFLRTRQRLSGTVKPDARPYTVAVSGGKIQLSEREIFMKREYPESPLVGVGAVIVKDSRVLLIRRGTAPLLGEWSLPGGVLECGESLCEAVIREAFEETGLTIETTDMLGVYERVIRGDEGRVRYHYVLIDFLCRPLGGNLAAGTDAADVRWFTRDELPALNLAYDANDVLHKGLARHSG